MKLLMEKHKCKLCSRSFSTGKALGGHMRSHLATLPLPSPKKPPLKQEFEFSAVGGGDSTESTSSDCFEEVKPESEEKCLVYGLRENPKKSFRLVDPEFLDAGSVIVQEDHREEVEESESESTRKPTRKRSKRTRRMLVAKVDDDLGRTGKKMSKPSSTESLIESEPPVSSVSSTSPEEDLAFCLLMLSRDNWNGCDHTITNTPDPIRTLKKKSKALGSHKSSHKKKKKKINNGFVMKNGNGDGGKVHECPFCGKVFGSGQALGGHKRSHFLSSSSTTTNTSTSTNTKVDGSLVESNNIISGKFLHGSLMIDLNLPAPMEEEEEQDF